MLKEGYNEKDAFELLLAQWSFLVRSRDKNVCQDCGSRLHLHAHHIKAKQIYPELALVVSNGSCLCIDCHIKIHSNENIYTEEIISRQIEGLFERRGDELTKALDGLEAWQLRKRREKEMTIRSRAEYNTHLQSNPNASYIEYLEIHAQDIWKLICEIIK